MSKKVVTAAVLAVVLTWSTVMIVLGHAAAAAVLLPSLGLLVQQIVQAITAYDRPGRTAADPIDAAPAGHDGEEAAR
ncbi:hypothetical protein C3489_11175 [Streptomyces sp. Ru71]|uniref:hypothetical protein n=1 Tax=Streptomyces sp. Ru71 TaxID=2080746 RepID=UPI000CDDB48B|nr:hypothetical protein [Streptomyces sp. Ru71]POX55334.1 hypothetical protein C3489_11175 [Streptomyces sp. Ru71]